MSASPDSRSPSGPPKGMAADHRLAQQHYRRGNRLFDLKALDLALAEWRRAVALWHGPGRAASRARRGPSTWPAVAGVFLTFLLIFNLLLVLFPRDGFELMLAGQGGRDSRSWWERWLDTGRPSQGGGERVGIREWWSMLRRQGNRRLDQNASRREFWRPDVAERWAELLRRYGQWGLYRTRDLNYHVISGYGLSRLGAYDKAVAMLEEGIARNPAPYKLGDLYQALANTHYFQGYHLQPDGLARYDLALIGKAAKAYESSVEYTPRPISYGNLGWMFYLLGDYDQAVVSSQRALALDDSLDYVRLNLALTYLVEDRIQDAFQTYREVARNHPTADTYLGGINDLRELVRDKPGRYPFAHLMIGVLTLGSGDYPLARESLARFLGSPVAGRYWREAAMDLLRQLETVEGMP